MTRGWHAGREEEERVNSWRAEWQMAGMVGEIMAIRDHDRDGNPWWLLLMRQSEMRGAEGRLGLAYLSAARGLLFGGPADAEQCLNELRGNTTGVVLACWCGSYLAPMPGFDTYSLMRRQHGFRVFASLGEKYGTDDVGAVCRRLVREAEALLQDGTPSLQPAGLQGSSPARISGKDMEDIEAVRRMLSDEGG